MPWRFNQASGFRQQGKYNRTSAAERSEIRREAVHPPPVQDAPPCPDLAHPEFYSKSSVFFPPLSNHPMKNAQVIPGEPNFISLRSLVRTATCQRSRHCCLAAAPKYPMSATTNGGHHSHCCWQYCRLGINNPPSETLAGVTQLTSGTNCTPTG